MSFWHNFAQVWAIILVIAAVVGVSASIAAVATHYSRVRDKWTAGWTAGEKVAVGYLSAVLLLAPVAIAWGMTT